MHSPFARETVNAVLTRLQRQPPLIQVIIGPRQVGKTTVALQVAERWDGPVIHAAADTPLPPGPEWIENQWSRARRRADAEGGAPLLVLDEVQKVAGWAESVKALWDDDRRHRRNTKVIVLGSSALLLAKGSTESLAGRFFLHRCSHWSYPECRAAFGWDLDRWVFFGGYPGAAPLADDEGAWRAYVADSLIETVLARDVLAMQNVVKPALLRHLFVLASQFHAQILSYNKMLGQLLDAGNTTTLAHYLKLLATAFLASGLERFSAGHAHSRGSSPKLVMWNNALVTALSTHSFHELRDDPARWGRLLENAVGAHLVGHLQALPCEVSYWRERNDEVDYVVRRGDKVWAVEVKSGRPQRPPGLAVFLRRHKGARAVIVGSGGIPFEEFFTVAPPTMFV